MKIAIGNDHAAVELKQEIMSYLQEKGYEMINVGTDTHESFNYPVSGFKVAKMVAGGEVDCGILICGTGLGMSYAANKVKGIRAACCSDYFSARLSREHNDANVLCFGARVVGEGTATDLVDVFIDTPFSGDERHQRRIDKITAIENK